MQYQSAAVHTYVHMYVHMCVYPYLPSVACMYQQSSPLAHVPLFLYSKQYNLDMAIFFSSSVDPNTAGIFIRPGRSCIIRPILECCGLFDIVMIYINYVKRRIRITLFGYRKVTWQFNEKNERKEKEMQKLVIQNWNIKSNWLTAIFKLRYSQHVDHQLCSI